MESRPTRRTRVLSRAPGFSAHRPNDVQTTAAGPRSCLVHLDFTGPIVTRVTSLYIDSYVAWELSSSSNTTSCIPRDCSPERSPLHKPFLRV
ncbi:hypothetical protein COCSADRAFT_210296 [Bipolaris sorokiniana ND90Pr]|uniref:Uncharacterized protein n=1 Tax=Cochliobolus sativus (strain ND90Pr / ATCC 201652) TaxID=665912 RepID=M2TLB3_COCSN|nr:uncharacterized protein COCSADRAFT_210296 [Bipolaris sorokiniana ND90Pr]EMD69467.1 hypothetical protein COCSADRAFT_210296 [Bipolaris sorokiniana ND90Pr]